MPVGDATERSMSSAFTSGQYVLATQNESWTVCPSRITSSGAEAAASADDSLSDRAQPGRRSPIDNAETRPDSHRLIDDVDVVGSELAVAVAAIVG
jgi:hypothetical protein